MKVIKKLAEAEWRIMDAIWTFAKPSTVRDIHQYLYPQGQKAYTTVQTITNILVAKRFLRKEKIGMVNFYFPTLSRQEFAIEETQTLVSRTFQGSFGNLANYLVDSGELSESDLRQLKELIAKKERGGGES